MPYYNQKTLASIINQLNTPIQNTDPEIEILRLLPVVPWQIKYL